MHFMHHINKMTPIFKKGLKRVRKSNTKKFDLSNIYKKLLSNNIEKKKNLNII